MPLPLSNSLRDRTPEFLAIAERLKRQNGAVSNGAHPTAAPAPPKTTAQHSSDFAKAAAEVGHGIHRTSLKLAKLAQLAKRTSMFDDPAQEVDELTGIIKQDIQALNGNIAELQRSSAQRSGQQEDPHNAQSVKHSHTVVDSLRSRLKDATQEFKEVLTVRTDSLKQHKERRQLFTRNADDGSSMPLLPRGRPDSQLAGTVSRLGGGPAHAPLNLGSGSGGASTSGGGGGGGSHASFLQTAHQQQQLTLAAPQQEGYHSTRAEALRNVESTIVELGSIFSRLSAMVAEQGELAIRIDENVEETLHNVTSAQEQLLKYLNSISSNRWLVLKVLGVLFVFLVLFIMFVV